MENIPRTHDDIDTLIRDIQTKKKELSAKNIREGVFQQGAVYDTEIYDRRSKGKYEGYVASIAVNDDVEDEEEVLPNSRWTGLGAPVAHFKDVAQGHKDFDPFADKKRPTIADREDEYRQRRLRRVLSPERIDPFADAMKHSDSSTRASNSAKSTRSRTEPRQKISSQYKPISSKKQSHTSKLKKSYSKMMGKSRISTITKPC